MKKQFLNLGKALSKAEQRSINGGLKDPLNELPGDGGGGEGTTCKENEDCNPHEICCGDPGRTHFCQDHGCNT